MTAGWLGSDDSNTGVTFPACAERAAGNDQGTATGISSVLLHLAAQELDRFNRHQCRTPKSTRTTIITVVAP